MSSDTIFGRIVRGEIPVERMYEDEVCLAFSDVAPVAPVHLLGDPKGCGGIPWACVGGA